MSEQKRERDTHTQGGREREREERKPPVRAYMCVWAVPLFSSRGGEETGRFHKNRTVRDGTFTNVKIQTKQTLKNKTKTETSGTLVMF